MKHFFKFFKTKKGIFVLVLFLIISISCVPTFILPKKKGKLSTNKVAFDSYAYFWDNFHAGNYDSIPKMINKLSDAYLRNNKDYKTAALLGFTHTWAVAECMRLPEKDIPYNITEHNTLAVKYFKESFDMNPKKDWRVYGFYAATYIIESAVHGNDRDLILGGVPKLQWAVWKYPEFNLFTKAYPLSMVNGKLDQSVETFWNNIEACLDEKIDRNNLDYRKYMQKEDLNSKKRTCWNSWLVPHNMEGFFLIFGDVLFKAGEYKQARNIYKNATYFDTYSEWDYKFYLEERMQKMDSVLNKEFTERKKIEQFKKMKFTNTQANLCMLCHQESNLKQTPKDAYNKLPDMEVLQHILKN